MKIRFLGDQTWATDGIQVCFDSDFLWAVDSQKGIERYALSTGKGTPAWNSLRGEELCVLIRTGSNSFFAGGSAGFGYGLETLPSGEMRLKSEKQLLQYFEVAACVEDLNVIVVAGSGQMLVVHSNGYVVQNDLSHTIDGSMVFSIEWISEIEKLLVRTSSQLLLVSLSGEFTPLPTPKGRVIAACSLSGRKQFFCAVGSGQNVRAFVASYDQPTVLLWDTQFQERGNRGGYENDQIDKCGSASFAAGIEKIALACNASLRFFSLSGDVEKVVRLPGPTYSTVFSMDEEHIAVGTWLGESYVFDKSGDMVRPRTCYARRVEELMFSSDESMLFCRGLGSSELFCWETKGDTLSWRYNCELDAIRDLLQVTEGKITVAREGFLVEGAVISVLDPNGHEHVMFPLDGFDPQTILINADRLAVVQKKFGKPYRLEVRRMPSGEVMSSVELREYCSKWLCHRSGVIGVYDGYHYFFVSTEKAFIVSEMNPPTEHRDLAFFFAGDESVVVVSKVGVFRTSLRVSNWENVVPFHASATAACAAGHDAVCIAFEDGRIELRSINDGSLFRSEHIELNGAKISACAVSTSVQFLAIGTYDGRMMLCSLM